MIRTRRASLLVEMAQGSRRAGDLLSVSSSSKRLTIWNQWLRSVEGVHQSFPEEGHGGLVGETRLGEGLRILSLAHQGEGREKRSPEFVKGSGGPHGVNYPPLALQQWFWYVVCSPFSPTGEGALLVRVLIPSEESPSSSWWDHIAFRPLSEGRWPSFVIGWLLAAFCRRRGVIGGGSSPLLDLVGRRR